VLLVEVAAAPGSREQLRVNIFADVPV
jgi:hypothetical protein